MRMVALPVRPASMAAQRASLRTTGLSWKMESAAVAMQYSIVASSLNTPRARGGTSQGGTSQARIGVGQSVNTPDTQLQEAHVGRARIPLSVPVQPADRLRVRASLAREWGREARHYEFCPTMVDPKSSQGRTQHMCECECAVCFVVGLHITTLKPMASVQRFFTPKFTLQKFKHLVISSAAVTLLSRAGGCADIFILCSL